MCLKQRQIFHGHRIFQHFHHVASFKSINSDFETGTSTTADLIPYPFVSGIEEQTPVLPGRIQLPIPALLSA